ncbi:MAG: hypothetical protein EAZ07_04850 [Cytophagales bacterium]|nr:MAG: hypothetical protein EAZ07_04850 [Cytophagales bacterium]
MAINVSEKEWKELSQDQSYIETYIEREQKNDQKTSTSSGINLPNFSFEYLEDIIYIIVFLSILLLLIKIIVSSSRNKVNINQKAKNITSKPIDKIEDKIHELDLEKLLEEALSANSFNMALRIHFLIIIKLLSEKGQIKWSKEKTNWEYFSEIRDPNLSSQFKKIILTFESIWYKEIVLSEPQYVGLVPDYLSLKTQLIRNEKQ